MAELSPTQKMIAATALAVLTAVGAVAEDNLNKDINLAGTMYTGSEFTALKESLIKDINDKSINYDEYNVWRAIVNRNIEENCGGRVTVFGANKDNIVEQVNQLTLKDKCQ